MTDDTDGVSAGLTDSEWMSLIDGHRDDGLQKCCASISGLRDVVIQMARDGGTVDVFAKDLLKSFEDTQSGHDGLTQIPALVKLVDACKKHLGA